MTTQQQIEQLSTQLKESIETNVQADIMMRILELYTSTRSLDAKPYIDQLSALAERTDSPLLRAWALHYLAGYHCHSHDFDTAHIINQQALALFEQLEDKKGIAASYNNIGNAYNGQFNFPEALKNHMLALKIFEELVDKKGLGRTHFFLGIVYDNQGNYPESMKNHEASLKHREETGDTLGMAASHGNIGKVYLSLGNHPEALKNHIASLKLSQESGYTHGIAGAYANMANIYFNEKNYTEALKNQLASIPYWEQTGNRLGLAGTYGNIGQVYERQGNYSEALKNAQASLALWQELGNKHGIPYAYNNIGNLYYHQLDYPEALKNYETALKLREEIGDKYGIAFSIGSIGNTYQKMGRYEEALASLLRATTISEEIGSKDNIQAFAFSLCYTYKFLGDHENALKYYEKFHQVESEIVGEESKKQLTNLSFMHNLEQKEKDLEIEHLRNVELKAEKDRSEALLLNILPAEVAEELKEKGTANAKHFDEVTVLFTDFKGFTTVSERLTPQQLVDELHACFSAFDEITHRYGIEKIKTVGDAYLAVAGLPLANEDHAHAMVKAAQEIRDFMLARKQELGEMTFEIRIGVHSGSVVAGIVGVKKFAYDIWGDTVNTAARMEQNSEAGKINISENTYQLVKDHFSCEYRGEIEAKNKGKLKMYFVN